MVDPEIASQSTWCGEYRVDEVLKTLLSTKCAGEAPQVLDELAKIFGSDSLVSEDVVQQIREYVEERRHLFTLPDGRLMQVTAEGRC